VCDRDPLVVLVVTVMKLQILLQQGISLMHNDYQLLRDDLVMGVY